MAEVFGHFGHRPMPHSVVVTLVVKPHDLGSNTRNIYYWHRAPISRTMINHYVFSVLLSPPEPLETHTHWHQTNNNACSGYDPETQHMDYTPNSRSNNIKIICNVSNLITKRNHCTIKTTSHCLSNVASSKDAAPTSVWHDEHPPHLEAWNLVVVLCKLILSWWWYLVCPKRSTNLIRKPKEA